MLLTVVLKGGTRFVGQDDEVHLREAQLMRLQAVDNIPGVVMGDDGDI